VKSRLAGCLHCGKTFRPSRRRHVFCSSFCRHRGERPVKERLAIDVEQLQRLFDPSRGPDELVRDDDWHPSPGPWQKLDWCQTVETRRTWYLNLKLEGLP
jgi:hypothetical protein